MWSVFWTLDNLYFSMRCYNLPWVQSLTLSLSHLLSSSCSFSDYLGSQLHDCLQPPLLLYTRFSSCKASAEMFSAANSNSKFHRKLWSKDFLEVRTIAIISLIESPWALRELCSWKSFCSVKAPLLCLSERQTICLFASFCLNKGVFLNKI